MTLCKKFFQQNILKINCYKGMIIMNKSEKKYMIIFIVIIAATILYAAALGEGIFELPDFITNKGYFMFS